MNQAKELTQKTFSEKLDAFKTEILAEAIESRKFRTTLQLFDLSPDQVQKLEAHAKSMEDRLMLEILNKCV